MANIAINYNAIRASINSAQMNDISELYRILRDAEERKTELNKRSKHVVASKEKWSVLKDIGRNNGVIEAAKSRIRQLKLSLWGPCSSDAAIILSYGVEDRVHKKVVRARQEKRVRVVKTRYTNTQKGTEPLQRKISSIATTTREQREEVQRAFAKMRIKAMAKNVPKEIRKAAVKAARDKRNPDIQEQGGVIAAAIAGVGAAMAVAFKCKKGAKDMYTSLSKTLSDAFQKLKKTVGKWVAVTVLLSLMYYFCRKYSAATKALMLAVSAVAIKLFGPSLWEAVSEFFREEQPKGVQSQSSVPLQGASSFLATLLCFQAFKGKNSQANVSEFAKRISNFDRMSTGLESFTKWILQTIESFIQWLTSKFGVDYKKKIRAEDEALRDFFKKVDAAIDKHNAEGIIVDNGELNSLVDLARQATSFKDIYRGTRLEASITAARASIHNVIHPHLGALNARKNSRPEPVMLVLHGKPGVGKTHLIEAICSALLIESGEVGPDATVDDVLAHAYQRGTSEYLNGYSGQFAFIMDDLWQQKPDPSDKDNEWINIIRMIGSWAMPLNFADVDSKGKIYFSSKLVLATTNMDSITSDALKVIHEPEAVMRRIKFPYTMRPVKEFQLNGKLNYEKMEAEIAKCADNPEAIDRFPWYVWEVARHDFMTGETSPIWQPMKELLLEMVDAIKAKRDQYSRQVVNKVNFISGMLAAKKQQESKGIQEQSGGLGPLQDISPMNKAYAVAFGLGATTWVNNCYKLPILCQWRGEANIAREEHKHNLLRQCRDARIYRDQVATVFGAVGYGLFNVLVVAAVVSIVKGLMAFIKALFGITKKAVKMTAVLLGKTVGLFRKREEEVPEFAFIEHYYMQNVREEPYDEQEKEDISAVAFDAMFGPKRFFDITGDMVYPYFGGYLPFDTYTEKGKLYMKTNRGQVLEVVDIREQSNRNAKIRPQSGERPCGAMVYANTYIVDAPTLDGVYLKLGQVLFVMSDMAVQPMHFTTSVQKTLAEGRIRPDTMLTFVNCANPAHTFQFTVEHYLRLKRERFPEDDLEAVCYEDVRAHKNIVSKFLPEKNIPSCAGMGAVLQLAKKASKGLVYYQPFCINSVRLGASLHYANKVLGRYFEYVAPTTPGDCGAPLTLMNERYAGGSVIMGLHVAGDVENSRGYSNIITRERIETMMTKLAVVADMFAVDCAVRGIVIEQGGVLPFKEQGSFLPVDTVEKPIHSAVTSKLYRTAAYGAFGPYDHKPAHLGRVFRDGEVVYPMENAVKPYSSPLRIYSQKWLPECVYQSMRKINELTMDYPRRIYSHEEAILGVPMEKFRSIPRGTAAGFPYVYYCTSGKKEFFGEGMDYDLTTPAAKELEERVEHIIEQAKQNRRLAHIFVDFLKDELRSSAKVDAVATRLISSAPLDYTIAWRRYFGSFSAAVMRNHTRCGFAPGICAYTEWDLLRTELSAKGDLVFDGDFKAFDSSEQPTIHRLILDEINAWYNDGEENARVRKVLWLDLVHSRHIGGNGIDQRHIYQWNKSLPSGHPFTTIVNSIYSMVLLIGAYRSITGRTDFWQHVNAVTYGDDNVCNVSAEIAPVYNQVTVAKALKEEFEVVYTPGRKDGMWTPTTDISQITFLKRGFAYDSQHGWLCPLELESFYYTCYYNKNRKDEKSILKDVLETTLLELSMHSQAVWDERAPPVLKLMASNGFIPMHKPVRDSYLTELKKRGDAWY